MSRKARLEYERAKYHVYNRGNYRAPIFREPGARKAFMECLLQACERAGWLLHAYALMSNHFHLGVETPRANLVEGMKWLQSTFANRFNRYRSEHGHVFQGRYHAKPLEDEFAMASVAHYIHLNPLEAGIVSIEDLGTFRDSSLWALLHPQARPPCLRVDAFLTQAGKFADTPAGHRSYLDYLRFLAADKEEQRRQAFEQACKGWAQGSEEWKRRVEARAPRSASGHSSRTTPWRGRPPRGSGTSLGGLPAALFEASGVCGCGCAGFLQIRHMEGGCRGAYEAGQLRQKCLASPPLAHGRT